MSTPEPSIFEPPDDDGDTLAMLEGEADADAGRVVPHSDFAAWLATWGGPEEKPPPTSWFK